MDVTHYTVVDSFAVDWDMSAVTTG